MDTEKDYYAILGVLPSIDDVALAAVYRALLKKYHPDVFPGSKADAEAQTREIIQAYEVIGNSEHMTKLKLKMGLEASDRKSTRLATHVRSQPIGRWSKNTTQSPKK
jgi:preprotein translocase subunit Sec63